MGLHGKLDHQLATRGNFDFNQVLTRLAIKRLSRGTNGLRLGLCHKRHGSGHMHIKGKQGRGGFALGSLSLDIFLPFGTHSNINCTLGKTDQNGAGPWEGVPQRSGEW